MSFIPNDEYLRALNAAIQTETDSKRLAQLVNRMIDAFDAKKGKKNASAQCDRTGQNPR